MLPSAGGSVRLREIRTSPGTPSGRSCTLTACTCGSASSPLVSAGSVPLAAVSRATRARARSSTSDSSWLEVVVGASLVTMSSPAMARWITRSTPAATTGVPSLAPRTRTSAVLSPASMVRVSVVS